MQTLVKVLFFFFFFRTMEFVKHLCFVACIGNVACLYCCCMLLCLCIIFRWPKNTYTNFYVTVIYRHSMAAKTCLTSYSSSLFFLFYNTSFTFLHMTDFVYTLQRLFLCSYKWSAGEAWRGS